MRCPIPNIHVPSSCFVGRTRGTCMSHGEQFHTELYRMHFSLKAVEMLTWSVRFRTFYVWCLMAHEMIKWVQVMYLHRVLSTGCALSETLLQRRLTFYRSCIQESYLTSSIPCSPGREIVGSSFRLMYSKWQQYSLMSWPNFQATFFSDFFHLASNLQWDTTKIDYRNILSALKVVCTPSPFRSDVISQGWGMVPFSLITCLLLQWWFDKYRGSNMCLPTNQLNRISSEIVST